MYQRTRCRCGYSRCTFNLVKTTNLYIGGSKQEQSRTPHGKREKKGNKREKVSILIKETYFSESITY